MSVKPPPRWTARSLSSMFLPHLFRSARNPTESTGVRKEKVPLDADEQHLYIKRKSAKMEKDIRSHFALNTDKPADAAKGALWSIATGEWVPQHKLKLEYIFPLSLGPMVAREVCPKITFRGSRNGIMIPQNVREAFNEWALIITPEKRFHHTRPASFMFRTLDSEAKSVRKPIWADSNMNVRDLDEKPLYFRNNSRPSSYACYFHSCCAMWKSTYLEDPDRSAREFWERYQLRMDGLWGTVEARKPILNIFKPPELVNVTEKDQQTTSPGDQLLLMNSALRQAEESQESVEEYDDGYDDDDDMDIGL